MKILPTLFVLLFLPSSLFGLEIKDLIGKSLEFKFENKYYVFDFHSTGEIISDIYDQPLNYKYVEQDDGFKYFSWEIINNENKREGNRGFFVNNDNSLIYATLDRDDSDWRNFRIEDFKIKEIKNQEIILLLTLNKIIGLTNKIDATCVIEQYLILKTDQKKEFINFFYNVPWSDRNKIGEYFDNYEENINDNEVDWGEVFIDDCVEN